MMLVSCLWIFFLFGERIRKVGWCSSVLRFRLDCLLISLRLK